jgi:hypothetical protein
MVKARGDIRSTLAQHDVQTAGERKVEIAWGPLSKEVVPLTSICTVRASAEE